MEDLVLTRQDGAIFEIILNRPEKRNAMNFELMQQLGQAIDRADRADGARVVFVRGEGAVFSSGIDLLGFNEIAEYMGENWSQNLFAVTSNYQGVLNKFERCRHPVIALLHGYCLGMAFELALACDFRFATAGAQMGLPETRLGLIPDVGGTTRLTRLVGPARAKELIMTGRTFDAAYAEQWGIVNGVVPADDLEQRGRDLAEELIAAAPLAVSYAKRVIDGIADIDRGLQLEAWAQNILIQTEDFANGAQAMMMKEKPHWKGR